MSYMSFWLICPYIDHTIQVILGTAKTLCQKFSRTSGQFNLPRAAPQWSLHHWYGLVYVLRSCVRSNQSISLGRRELTFFWGESLINLLWDASNLLGSWPLASKRYKDIHGIVKSTARFGGFKSLLTKSPLFPTTMKFNIWIINSNYHRMLLRNKESGPKLANFRACEDLHGQRWRLLCPNPRPTKQSGCFHKASTSKVYHVHFWMISWVGRTSQPVFETSVSWQSRTSNLVWRTFTSCHLLWAMICDAAKVTKWNTSNANLILTWELKGTPPSARGLLTIIIP